MAIRSTLASLLGGDSPSDLDIRRMVSSAIVEHQAADTARVDALEAENEQLKKKLSMAMGAVQAATAQLMALKNDVGQVDQRVTTATATAEAATDGVTGLEQRVDALMEKLGTAAPAAPVKRKGDQVCAVDGCENKHRARGYCARHYQQWKRGTL